MSWSLFTDLLGYLVVLFFLEIARSVFRGRRGRKKAVAFFHPYTNDGGGGERVLWCAVRAVQEERPDLDCVVYTGDRDATSASLRARAADRFGVELLSAPQVVHLYTRKLVEASTYPYFTMIGQSLGSVILSWEALRQLTPAVYFDTSGYAFTYPVARMFGCKVICYTHYPTISLDMLSRVRGRSSMYNNKARIADSIWLSQCKIIYYVLFSWMYGFVGSFANLAMVNSSWTRSHILKLWGVPHHTKRVYPPCDTSGLQALPLERAVETPIFISVAQFRPEKAHGLQLEAFSLAVTKLDHSLPRPKLQFVGSCRNKSDEDRLQNLKDRAAELGVAGDVEFYKNMKYRLLSPKLEKLCYFNEITANPMYDYFASNVYLLISLNFHSLMIRDLVELLGHATSGLHSMIDEHFGISVVEYMAAGAIPIAHNSAGPKMDIVLEEDGQQTGFLAQDVEEYAEAILKIIAMPESERLKMAAAARKRAGRFSEERFYHDFKAAVHPILC